MTRLRVNTHFKRQNWNDFIVPNTVGDKPNTFLDSIATVFVSCYEHSKSGIMMALYACIFILLPWLCIPAYALRSMWKSVGSIKMRFQRCCRPTDWYPIDTEERQRYEEAMGTLDITHQLYEITEEVL